MGSGAVAAVDKSVAAGAGEGFGRAASSSPPSCVNCVSCVPSEETRFKEILCHDGISLLHQVLLPRPRSQLATYVWILLDLESNICGASRMRISRIAGRQVQTRPT